MIKRFKREMFKKRNLMSIRRYLAQAIKHFRAKTGLNQQQVADLVDVVSGGYISNIENEKRWARDGLYDEMFKKMGISYEEVFKYCLQIKSGKTTKPDRMDAWMLKIRALLNNYSEKELKNVYNVLKNLYPRKKKKSS
jgi:transcriptional regulator with XRE-family HTH domain